MESHDRQQTTSPIVNGSTVAIETHPIASIMALGPSREEMDDAMLEFVRGRHILSVSRRNRKGRKCLGRFAGKFTDHADLHAQRLCHLPGKVTPMSNSFAA
jgi:hypothetical protein